MSLDPSPDGPSNRSPNPSLSDVIAAGLSRRRFMAYGLGAAAALAPPLAAPARGQGSLIGFTAVPISVADRLTVPPGYTAEVLYAWGNPISDGPAFRPDASNSAEEQVAQAGMHHDGMHFFPLGAGSAHGLLAVHRATPGTSPKVYPTVITL